MILRLACAPSLEAIAAQNVCHDAAHFRSLFVLLDDCRSLRLTNVDSSGGCVPDDNRTIKCVRSWASDVRRCLLKAHDSLLLGISKPNDRLRIVDHIRFLVCAWYGGQSQQFPRAHNRESKIAVTGGCLPQSHSRPPQPVNLCSQGDTACCVNDVQPFSQKSHTPTVPKEFQIGLWAGVESGPLACGQRRATSLPPNVLLGHAQQHGGASQHGSLCCRYHRAAAGGAQRCAGPTLGVLRRFGRVPAPLTPSYACPPPWGAAKHVAAGGTPIRRVPAPSRCTATRGAGARAPHRGRIRRLWRCGLDLRTRRAGHACRGRHQRGIPPFFGATHPPQVAAWLPASAHVQRGNQTHLDNDYKKNTKGARAATLLFRDRRGPPPPRERSP